MIMPHNRLGLYINKNIKNEYTSIKIFLFFLKFPNIPDSHYHLHVFLIWFYWCISAATKLGLFHNDARY